MSICLFQMDIRHNVFWQFGKVSTIKFMWKICKGIISPFLNRTNILYATYFLSLNNM